jgi:hypothetical protein
MSTERVFQTFVRALLPSLCTLACALAPAGCAEPGGGDADPSPTEEEAVAESSQELVSKDLRCGQVEGFPTWSFWGETTLQLVNYEPSSGKTIEVMYQAGAGAPVSTLVGNQPTVVKGRWGGLTLFVTYLGYSDSAGYHACNVTNPNEPALQAKTW